MKRCLVIALFLHLLLLIYLVGSGHLEFELFRGPTHDDQLQINIESSGSLSARNEIWQAINRYASLSSEERLAELRRLLQQSLSISQNSLDGIGRHLGLDAESYIVKKGSARAFEQSSATIYSISREAYPEGAIGYCVTLIDYHGTTLEIRYAPEDVTPDLELSYRAMELLELNPALKQMVIRFLATWRDR